MKLTNGVKAIKNDPPDTPRAAQAQLATWPPAVGSKKNKKNKKN